MFDRNLGPFGDVFERIQKLEEQLMQVRAQLAATHAGTRIISTSITGAPTFNPMPLIQRFVNNSGGSLADGDVVILDTTGARLITTTTTPGDINAIGVVRDTANSGPFTNGAETPVMLAGNHATVKVTGAVSAGDYLAASSTAKRAESVGAAMVTGAFAIAEADNLSGDAAIPAFIFGIAGGGDGAGRFYIPFGSDVTDGQS